MFRINGEKYNSEIEYCFREENKKNTIEFYIQTLDNSNSINFITFLSLEELNNFELDEEIFFNEYLVIDDIVLKKNNEFINLSVDDIDVRIIKILKNKFKFHIEIPEYKIIISSNLIFKKN